ncbi:hypothetical protein BKA70DRAFT_781440 [Coprinopsis sp. MPI-PUGE-AT-0042]|nr:hypothetical protein BKA70DRAFT_781440 [Coprinopsis sp. MPI-PUGE-AT-0042]
MEAAPAVDREHSCEMMPGSIATKNGVAPLTCQAEYHIPVTASIATQVAPIGSPRPSTALVDRQYEQTGPPERLASAPQHDLYASNLLETFSFGTATTPPSISGRPFVSRTARGNTGQAPRRRRTSVASTNTLGLPYTPASVASSDGCASHHGVSEHHHPTRTSSRNSPTGTHATYSDERHDDDRSEPQIDVSSEIHEDFGRYTSWNRSRRSFASSAHSGKRGQVVPIPLPSSLEVRDREDSAAADHRPSRSLEGLKPDNFEHANNLYEYRPPLAPPTTTSVPEDFDASWAKTTAGISVFEWDPSERADALGGFQGPSGSSRGFRGDGANPANSGRRSSTSTTSTDAFSRHLKQLGGQEYADEKAKWTFIRVPDGGQDKRSHDRDQRSSISSIWRVSASSRIGSSVASRDAIAAFAFVGRMLGKDKGAPWKGMALDAEELWSSGANGRYRVARKNHAVEGKTPQERLHIVRHGNSPYSPSGGPSIIIHRHSKAAGFSITCHPRHKTSLNDEGRSAEAAAQDAHMPTTDRKKSSPRILLASQKVQEAYTSTSTTNKLKTHGFLNKSSRHSSHDQHDREQEAKRENEKQHQKRLGKGKEKSTGKTTSSQEPASDETGGATNSESSKGKRQHWP